MYSDGCVPFSWLPCSGPRNVFTDHSVAGSRSEELGPLHVAAESRNLVISAATKSYFSVLMADFTNSGVDAHGEEQNEEIIEKTMKSNNIPQK